MSMNGNITEGVKNLPVNMKKRTVRFKIENIVAVGKISDEIDLSLIADKYTDVSVKTNFPGIDIKIHSPKCTILLFKSGKMVITGIKSKKSIPLIVERVKKKLGECGIRCYEDVNMEVVNIVASCTFNTEIKLEDAFIGLTNAIYDPEIFPGIVYRMDSPNVCYLIFKTGKIICTGARNEKHIIDSLKKLGISLKDADAFEGL